MMFADAEDRAFAEWQQAEAEAAHEAWQEQRKRELVELQAELEDVMQRLAVALFDPDALKAVVAEAVENGQLHIERLEAQADSD